MVCKYDEDNTETVVFISNKFAIGAIYVRMTKLTGAPLLSALFSAPDIYDTFTLHLRNIDKPSPVLAGGMSHWAHEAMMRKTIVTQMATVPAGVAVVRSNRPHGNRRRG
jgi:hypothetical protein